MQDIFILWKNNLRYEMLLLVTEYVLNTWVFNFFFWLIQVCTFFADLLIHPVKRAEVIAILRYTELRCFVCIQEHFLYFLHWNFNFLV